MSRHPEACDLTCEVNEIAEMYHTCALRSAGRILSDTRSRLYFADPSHLAEQKTFESGWSSLESRVLSAMSHFNAFWLLGLQNIDRSMS